jgi:hypothetical protein
MRSAIWAAGAGRQARVFVPFVRNWMARTIDSDLILCGSCSLSILHAKTIAFEQTI